MADVDRENSGLRSRFADRSRWLLAEIVVIVVGVLIALAIDEWRGNAADAQRESEYLNLLVNDLDSTEQAIRDVVTDNSLAVDAARRLVTLFETKPDVTDDEIRQLLSDIKFLDNPVPNTSTAQALITTGDLRLIQDPVIRSELTRYLSRSRDYWLVPIYQLEEDHRRIYRQLLAVAQQFGISPQHRQGMSRREKNPARVGGVDAFLSDSDAYVHAASLLEIKSAISLWRSAMSSEAAELRGTIQQASSPD